MTDPEENSLRTAIHAVWDGWAAPVTDDIKGLAQEWPPSVWPVFAGVPPMQVDTGSPGFLQCTPLFDLSPKGAAAYLGTYLLSFLDGAVAQFNTGLFYDVTTRAHLLHCLSSDSFWQRCIYPTMPPQGRDVLSQFVDFLVRHQTDFALPKNDAETMQSLARKP